MKEAYTTGLTGEAAAEAYLTGRGMTVLARRYRAADGEIDLIMADGDTVVFVEVKTRPSARRGAGLQAITPAKQRRMLHAAQMYAAEQGLTDVPMRFDVVELTRDGVLHLPNVLLRPKRRE